MPPLAPYRADSKQLMTIIENVDDFEEAIRSDRTVAWLDGFLCYWLRRWPVTSTKKPKKDRDRDIAEEKLRVYQAFAENTTYARTKREHERLLRWGLQVDEVVQQWLVINEPSHCT